MKKTLLVMAAGMGSRFGGLKQITPVDEDGNFIIDYSVFDAKRAGFDTVVFVIKKENLKDFEESIGKRLKDKIEVKYAFQDKDDIPVSLDISKREKPWGTVQAVLCAKDLIEGSFIEINADDFYGKDAFVQAAKFLDENKEEFTYANICYPIGMTMSAYGAVKRAVLELKNNKITSMVESSVTKEENKFLAEPLMGGDSYKIDEDTLVSTNFFAFKKDVFGLLEEYWLEYFNQDDDKILKGEVLLPICLEKYLQEKKIEILACPTKSEWFGMTYKSDLDMVKEKIKDLKVQGVYPEKLWE